MSLFTHSIIVSTHSRPKAAGVGFIFYRHSRMVSTHSRPKAAGDTVQLTHIPTNSFNTQPPEGGWG